MFMIFLLGVVWDFLVCFVYKLDSVVLYDEDVYDLYDVDYVGEIKFLIELDYRVSYTMMKMSNE